MSTLRLTGILLGCALAIAHARFATADVIQDSGEWFALFAQGDLFSEEEPPSWRWWFDGQARFFDDFDGFGQSLVRPGIGYKLNDSTTVWAGYAWVHTSPAGEDFDESRVWQQLTWTHKFEPTTFDWRSRLEQRFLETGDDTGWRFRQLIALRRPLDCAPTFTLVAWDEFFFHLNDTDWGARGGFDQNRLFLGAGWKPSKEATWRVEAGYLHQYIDRATQPDVSNHLLSLNLFWNP